MDSELQVILFEINCTIYKLNKLGKFWYIYGQLLNIVSRYVYDVLIVINLYLVTKMFALFIELIHI